MGFNKNTGFIIHFSTCSIQNCQLNNNSIGIWILNSLKVIATKTNLFDNELYGVYAHKCFAILSDVYWGHELGPGNLDPRNEEGDILQIDFAFVIWQNFAGKANDIN